MKAFKIFIAIGLFATVLSCSSDDDPMETCDTADLTYTSEIAGIINGSCAVSGCHASGTTTTFPMGNYTETLAAVGFGRIIGAINQETGFEAMPRNGAKLADCTIDKVTAWINDGAPE